MIHKGSIRATLFFRAIRSKRHLIRRIGWAISRVGFNPGFTKFGGIDPTIVWKVESTISGRVNFSGARHKDSAA